MLRWKVRGGSDNYFHLDRLLAWLTDWKQHTQCTINSTTPQTRCSLTSPATTIQMTRMFSYKRGGFSCMLVICLTNDKCLSPSYWLTCPDFKHVPFSFGHQSFSLFENAINLKGTITQGIDHWEILEYWTSQSEKILFLWASRNPSHRHFCGQLLNNNDNFLNHNVQLLLKQQQQLLKQQ